MLPIITCTYTSLKHPPLTEMAFSNFPIELVQKILAPNPYNMFLVNKELTDLYFKIKYSKIELPSQTNVLKCFLFPCATYVKTIELSLHCKLNFLDDFSKCCCVKTLIIQNDFDVFNQLPNSLPQLTSLTELICSELNSSYITPYISKLIHLTSLEVNTVSSSLSQLNQLSSLIHLTINTSCAVELEFSVYATISPLHYIQSLVVYEHYKQDIDVFHQVFTNLKSLTIEESQFDTIYTFHPDLHLNELTCCGSFNIPENITTLTIINTDAFMRDPPPLNTTFLKTSFRFDYFSQESKTSFLKCMAYLKQASHLVTVSFDEELIFMNQFKPPFDDYFHFLLDLNDVHVFCKSFEQCFACDEILQLQFLHEFTHDKLLDNTDWEMKELEEDDAEDDYFEECRMEMAMNDEFEYVRNGYSDDDDGYPPDWEP